MHTHIRRVEGEISIDGLVSNPSGCTFMRYLLGDGKEWKDTTRRLDLWSSFILAHEISRTVSFCVSFVMPSPTHLHPPLALQYSELYKYPTRWKDLGQFPCMAP